MIYTASLSRCAWAPDRRNF